MTIVWSGKGYLSVVVLIASMFICLKIFPDNLSDYGIISAFLITGIFSLIYGHKWNDGSTQIGINERTGEEVIITPNHSLFWIPLQYWGLLFPIGAIIILFQNSVVAGYIAVLVFGVLSFGLFRSFIKFIGTKLMPKEKKQTSQSKTKSAVNKEPKITNEAIERIKNQEVTKSKTVDMSKEDLDDYHKRYMPG